MRPSAALVATAVILAGGFGKRLKPVVSDRPKPLALVCGKPFVEWLLMQLANAGFKTVVICTGYKAGMLVATLGYHYRSMRNPGIIMDAVCPRAVRRENFRPDVGERYYAHV
jgi:choline kinase